MFHSPEQEAHNEQARVEVLLGNVCRHGRAAGVSSFDVPFCGACEVEDYYDAQEERGERDDDHRHPEAARDYELFALDAVSIAEEERAAQRDAFYGTYDHDDVPF